MAFRSLAPNETSLRRIVEVVRGAMQGKTNNTNTFTITASAATTVITDLLVGGTSVIIPSPTTASAATEWASGGMYISSIGKQTFTVTHNNSAPTDRVFTYAVIS